MSETALGDYLKNVEKYYKLGIATEHTYRPALQDLLLALTTHITVLNEPKRVKCGAPDYAVLRNTPHGTLTVGYVEAKDVGIALDKNGLQATHDDDYVKFIRFAQWRIEQTGYDILAFISNHGYLDNPTFRGMRQSLMQSFDEIYVLDLHGNSKKKERSPDGSKDENVFDIQQGVAIGIFVKRQGKGGTDHTTKVHHAHLWGPREIQEKVGQGQMLVGGKYHWLAENDVTTIRWTRYWALRPHPHILTPTPTGPNPLPTRFSKSPVDGPLDWMETPLESVYTENRRLPVHELLG